MSMKMLSVEMEICCCAPRFPLTLTAKLHSLYVKESELIVGNFGKVVVGYFTSDSATLENIPGRKEDIVTRMASSVRIVRLP